MAGNMHMPDFRPHCWLDPAEHPPETLEPRQGWAWDAASACADAMTADSRARQFAHTPGCRGCSRRARAVQIEDGRTPAHPQRIGRAARQLAQECGVGGGEHQPEPGQLEATQRATSERREGEGA